MLRVVREWCARSGFSLLVAVLLGILVLGLSGCGERHEYQGLVFDEPQPAEDIVGTLHTGAPYQLRDSVGEMSLIFFGYTNCPDICPITLSTMATAYRQLESESKTLADDLNVLFVTVDPQRDTVDRLAKYVPAFHPDFLGIYVPTTEQKRVKASYGVYGELREPEDEHNHYEVDHTAGIYLIDRRGDLKALFKSDMGPNALAADLQALLRQKQR